jgi:copper chaperone CopZ
MTRLPVLIVVALLASCTETPSEQPAQVTAIANIQAAEPVQCTVSIEGMHCQNCANAVSRAMNGCSQVRSVAVSFEQSQATIFAANDSALDCAILAAREAGYTVGAPEPIEHVVDEDFAESVAPPAIAPGTP